MRGGWLLPLLPSLAVCKPPNILLMVADDLGWADVSWHNPEVIMPNIATLASSGVRLGSQYLLRCYRK